jgi:hypothetical protein
MVRRLLPERHDEFRELYRAADPVPASPTGQASRYAICDFLEGAPLPAGAPPTPDARTLFASRFNLQLSILASARERIDARLGEADSLLAAALFDAQLAAAAQLLASGWLRSAAVLAGTTLELHLGRVCARSGVAPIATEASTVIERIGAHNDALENAGFILPEDWRLVQRLATLLERCTVVRSALDGDAPASARSGPPRPRAAADRAHEPSPAEIAELLRGVRKARDRVF